MFFTHSPSSLKTATCLTLSTDLLVARFKGLGGKPFLTVLGHEMPTKSIFSEFWRKKTLPSRVS